MSLGVYIRIHAKRNGRLAAHEPSHAVDLLQFITAFYVEHEDASAQGISYLVICLSHSGIDDLPRVHAGPEGSEEFASGDYIRTCAALFQDIEDSDVGTCLDREADDVRYILESAVVCVHVPFQGGGAVDVEWRAVPFREYPQRHVLCMQFTPLVSEIIHKN
jgi:hypothetical protein